MFWASLTFSLTEALFIYPFFVGLCAARHRQKGKAMAENKENVTPAVPTMTIKDGGSTVVIGFHFSSKQRETLDDKLKRMIRADVKTGNF